MAVTCLLCGNLVSVGGQTETPQKVPSADEIALLLHKHNQQREAALGSYESRRLMTLQFEGFGTNKRATEKVDMVYTAPGSKRFTVVASTGSVLLRDSVFEREMEDEKEAADPKERAASALTPANYTLRLVGVQQMPEGECYVLEVAPRNASRFSFTGRVWVQSVDFAVVRIEAVPAQNPSLWVHEGAFTATFGKIGDFWLPKETVSSSHLRLGGHATFTIRFGPYRILEAHPVISVGEHP